MKPNFILELSQTGVLLRDMAAGKGDVLGEVALADPDFDAKVRDLRNRIAEKSDEPLATELRLPDSEILYSTLDDPQTDEKTPKAARREMREKAVKESLEGMTPYDLNDLVLVWKMKGKSELSLAAVSRSTLAEAEEFASRRGFNPVRFAAQPGKSKFPGIVQFGPTALQRARAAAEARARQEEEERAANPPPLPEPTPEPKPEPKTEQEPEPAAPAVVEVAESPASSDATKPSTDAADGASAPDAPKPDPSEPDPSAIVAAARRFNIAPMDPLPGDTDADAATASDDPPRSGFSQPRIDDTASPPDDVPPMPVSFASRRRAAAGDGIKTPGALSPGSASDADDSTESRLSRIAARLGGSEKDGLGKGIVPPPPPRRGGPAASGSGPSLRGSDGKPGARAPRAKTAGGLPDGTAAAASLTPATDASGQLLDGKARASVSARMASGRKLDEAEAMTVFGARSTPGRRGGTPLAIALAALVLLAVTAWGAYYLTTTDLITGDGDTVLPDTSSAAVQPDTTPEPAAPVAAIPDGADTATAIDPPETVTEAEPVAEPVPAPEPTETAAQPTPGTDIAGPPDAQDPGNGVAGRAGVPDSTVATLGPLTPDAPVADALPRPQTAPHALSRDPLHRPPTAEGGDAMARYATTGIWIAPPAAPDAPSGGGLDGLRVATLETGIDLGPTGPAPRLSTLDVPAPPRAQLSPAPAGPPVELNELGLVRATPEGALSPDGILITAGPPPLTPPPRPGSEAAAAPDAEPASIEAAAPEPVAPTLRPRARPTAAQPDTATPEPAPEAPVADAPAPDAPLADAPVVDAPADPAPQDPVAQQPEPDEQTSVDIAAGPTDLAELGPRIPQRATPDAEAPGANDTRPRARPGDAPAAATDEAPVLTALGPRISRIQPGEEATPEGVPDVEVAQRVAAPSPETPRPRSRPGSDVEPTLGDETVELAALAPPSDADPARPDAAASPDSAQPTPEADADAETVQARARAAALAVSGASTASPEAPLTTPVPRPIPASLAALRAAPVGPATPDDATDETADETADEPGEISPFAVAQSRLPRNRPGNFATTVATARRAAPAPAPQEQVATRVAAPAAVVTPSIPSRASVTQQATVKNAINLGKVNLIGVYGATSNRRALVRLASGRFVKVKVGDSVDGGRVASIGQSDLRYTKSGRNVTLSMPSG